jgi:hypothetical protein
MERHKPDFIGDAPTEVAPPETTVAGQPAKTIGADATNSGTRRHPEMIGEYRILRLPQQKFRQKFSAQHRTPARSESRMQDAT